jgi:hypothetical protein
LMDVIRKHMKGMEAGKMGMSTTEVGDLIANYIDSMG